MNAINVAFAVDINNLDQVAVVITSILANSRDPAALRFFIVLDGAAEAAEQRMRGWAVKPANLTLIPYENAFAGRARVRYITTAALLRTQLPNALPELDRVLYLDADVIVLRDIAELYRSDLGGKAVGGVADLGMYIRTRRGKIHGDPRCADYFKGLGLDLQQSDYVNSGVLVMDLRALRDLNFSAKALAFSNEHGTRLITMDQCLTNVILAGRIARLDPRWNAFGHVMNQPRHHHYLSRRLQPGLRLQENDPWLVHYTGGNKPWNSADVWRADDWWVHARNSGIAWQPPGAGAARRTSRLMSAWRSVTWGVSYAFARVYPD